MWKSVNPATEEIIEEHPLTSEELLEELLRLSLYEFNHWFTLSSAKRGEYFKKVGELLQDQVDIHAETITKEMGKPLKEARSEVIKCAKVCHFYAEKSEEFLADREVKTESAKSYISFRPLGPILGIMPWNFPYWQVFRFAVPTIMAGNTVLLKHSSNVTGCLFKIQNLFDEAGFPPGVFQEIRLENETIKKVIADERVSAVSLTGSVGAGKAVAKTAGENLKKVVLELGGNDPYLVLDDADLDLAAENIVASRMLNAGQSCISAKRVIVTSENHLKLREKLTYHLEQQNLGDPMQDETDIGPLARKDLRDKVANQVEKSLSQGATAILGGKVPERKGYYYQPTLLTGVKPGVTAFEEEVFGPVISLIEAKDEKQAVQLANQSSFGLGGGVFSRNIGRAEMIARDLIQTGSCFVNGTVVSDQRLPFGGIKNSGIGRELSEIGIHEFTNIKTIVVAKK